MRIGFGTKLPMDLLRDAAKKRILLRERRTDMITTRNSASGALALAVLIAALGTVSTALSHAMEVESTLQSDIAQQCCKPILESDMLALDWVADGYLFVS